MLSSLDSGAEKRLSDLIVISKHSTQCGQTALGFWYSLMSNKSSDFRGNGSRAQERGDQVKHLALLQGLNWDLGVNSLWRLDGVSKYYRFVR